MTENISIISLILNANIIVQIVIYLLFASSIFSWMIVFNKAMLFIKLNSKIKHFQFSFETLSMEEIYKLSKNDTKNPFSQIFLACANEWKKFVKSERQHNNVNQYSLIKDKMLSNGTNMISKSVAKIESKIYLLAILGSVTPFVGLFGTVIGILSSFNQIAESKSTNLAVIAPGISEALLATGIGLFVAIPAVFFYNIFSQKVNNFSENAEIFLNDLVNIFLREID